MNFSAKLKSVHQPPNYVFNFNIDIPFKVKDKQKLSQRSNGVSPSKSPNKLGIKKYKLSSVTPRVSSSKKGSQKQKTNNKGNKHAVKQIPKTMKEEFLQKDLYHLDLNVGQNHRLSKKTSPCISRRTERIIGTGAKDNSGSEDICPSRKTVKNANSHRSNNNSSRQPQFYSSKELSKQIANLKKNQNMIRKISILEKLVTDDNIIKYTTSSSEIRNENQQAYNLRLSQNRYLQYERQKLPNRSAMLYSLRQQEKPNYFSDNNEDDVDLIEIREFQQVSTQRKQRIHFEYLREKFLIEASVRKIQRAWRNYQTKKLVNSYSNQIALKLGKKPLIGAQSQIMSKNNSLGLNLSLKKSLKADKNGALVKSQNSSQSSITSLNKNKNSRLQINQDFEQDSSSNNPTINSKQDDIALYYKGNFSFANHNKQLSQSQSEQRKNNRDKPAVFFHHSQNQEQIKQNNKYNGKVQRFQGSNYNQFDRQREVQEKLRKFQQQEIKKWQSILQSIKKGNNIQKLLQKSQNYKQQLQNNLKVINQANEQKNIFINSQKNRASPILFRTKHKNEKVQGLGDQSSQRIFSDNPITPLTPLEGDADQLFQLKSFPSKKQKTQGFQQRQTQNLNQTAQKRKERIMFFQNQILKIDNQQYSQDDISSVSCQSFQKISDSIDASDGIRIRTRKSPDYHQNLEQRQKQENLKLRKKLQLFNTHFLDLSSADEGLTDRSLKNNEKNFHKSTALQISKQKTKDGRISPKRQEKQLNFVQRSDVRIYSQKQSSEVDKKKKLQKIEQLMNKKLQYLQDQDQHQDMLGEPLKYNINSNDKQKITQPVLTHRERKAEKQKIPHLNLNSLPKFQEQLPQADQDDQSNQAQSISAIIQIQKLSNQECKSRESQTQDKMAEVAEKKLKEMVRDFDLLDNKEKTAEETLKKSKVQMSDVLKICSSFEEQLIYEVLLQFSDSDHIVQSIKGLFDSFRKQKKKPKPEGICTNLESIKDYLQNFVGFVYENKLTEDIEKSLWTPNGPSVQDLLKYLRRDSEFDSSQNDYIMAIDVFQKHWKYANSNIYFDQKYKDKQTQEQRVAYLKGLTRVYFRSIFDSFNESLEYQRSYGMIGMPYPWSSKHINRQNRQNLKTAFQQAYRRILKISVVYCGVHFDDKSHIMNQDSIKEIQQERLLSLITMQLEEDEFRWNFFQDQTAEVKYDLGLIIQQELLQQVLSDIKGLTNRQI